MSARAPGVRRQRGCLRERLQRHRTNRGEELGRTPGLGGGGLGAGGVRRARRRARQPLRLRPPVGRRTSRPPRPARAGPRGRTTGRRPSGSPGRRRSPARAGTRRRRTGRGPCARGGPLTGSVPLPWRGSRDRSGAGADGVSRAGGRRDRRTRLLGVFFLLKATLAPMHMLPAFLCGMGSVYLARGRGEDPGREVLAAADGIVAGGVDHGAGGASRGGADSRRRVLARPPVPGSRTPVRRHARPTGFGRDRSRRRRRSTSPPTDKTTEKETRE